MTAQRSDEDLKSWHRWFAIDCNNSAWTLVERSLRSPEEDEAMLLRSYAAAYHWIAIGTEDNRALAYALLAHAHGLLGHASLAKSYAEKTHAFFDGSSETWKRAFTATAMALAAVAARDAVLHAKHHAEAAALRAELNPEDREIFDKTFERVPCPATSQS